MNMREFTFRLLIGRKSFHSRVADDFFFCDVTCDSAWHFGRTYCIQMQLSTSRTRTGLTLLQCVQNWFHFYCFRWLPCCVESGWCVKVKINVEVMSGLGLNGHKLHVPACRHGTIMPLLAAICEQENYSPLVFEPASNILSRTSGMWPQIRNRVW
jgi:hypothetical protein